MSDVMTPVVAELRALAEQCNAWPFEEARKIVARLERHPKDEVIFETGYGPSGLPHIGTFGEVARTTMVRHAFRTLTGGQGQDAADRVFRRHGRAAQGARQHSRQGAGGPASRQAVDPGARSLRHPSELRRPQQCAAARLPRRLRLRLRVPVVDPVLHVRAVRCRAAHRARPLRRGDGDHAAVVAGGARAILFAVPADLAAHRRGAAGPDPRP